MSDNISDILRTVTICYALVAVAFNVRNLVVIHAGVGPTGYLATAVRMAVVDVLFVTLGIGEIVVRLGKPITWRSPALFVCCTVYLWSQVKVHVQLMAEQARRRHPMEPTR